MQVKRIIILKSHFDVFVFDRYKLCHMPVVAVVYRGLFDEVNSHCLKCANILPQNRTTRSLILANDRLDHNIIILTQDLDFLTCVKNLHLPHIRRKSGTCVRSCLPNYYWGFKKRYVYATIWMLNQKQIIWFIIYIYLTLSNFDACVKAKKVLVYYLSCCVEVDGLRNKTK